MFEDKPNRPRESTRVSHPLQRGQKRSPDSVLQWGYAAHQEVLYTIPLSDVSSDRG